MDLENKIEKVIVSYIPKNTRCRFDEQKRQMIREKEKKEIMQQAEKIEMPITLSLDFEKLDPDMSVCRACKDTIFGDQFRMKIMLNDTVIAQNRPINLCKTCYEKIG